MKKPRTTFKSNDLVIGCDITLELSETEISLTIGGRDMQWDRKTGKIVSAGGMLDAPIPTVKNVA